MTKYKNPNVKRKHLTSDDYDQIKLLAAAGLKGTLVAEVSQRSNGTVGRVLASKNFEDYKQELSRTNAIYHARANAKKGIKVADPKPPTSDDFFENESPAAPAPEMPLSYNEARMERIACALERLADAWERQPEQQPKRNGIFRG